jgi:hypothetical protein
VPRFQFDHEGKILPVGEDLVITKEEIIDNFVPLDFFFPEEKDYLEITNSKQKSVK